MEKKMVMGFVVLLLSLSMVSAFSLCDLFPFFCKDKSVTGMAAVGEDCTSNACGDDGDTQLYCNPDTGKYQFSQYCSTTDRTCEGGYCKAICGDGICGIYETYANCAGTYPIDCPIDSEDNYCDNDFDDDWDGDVDCDDSDCSSDSDCISSQTCSQQSGHLILSGQSCGGNTLEASDGDCCDSYPLCEVGALVPYGNTCDCRWGPSGGSGGVTWSTESVPIWCCDSGTYPSGPCPDVGGTCPINTKLDYDTSLNTQCKCGDTDAYLGNCGSAGYGTYGYYCCDTNNDGVGDVCQSSACSSGSLTCSSKSGDTCTSDQLCVGQWVDVDDTNYCCLGTCTSSGCVAHAVDGPDYVIATRGITGQSTNYCVDSDTRGVYYCQYTDEAPHSEFEARFKEMECTEMYGCEGGGCVCDSADARCKTPQEQQSNETATTNETTVTDGTITTTQPTITQPTITQPIIPGLDQVTNATSGLTPEQRASIGEQTTEVTEAIVLENGTASCSQGCLYEAACFPIGIRKKINGVNSYCNVGLSEGNVVYVWDPQREEDFFCENHHECRSNFCVDDKCVKQGLITRIINWFKRLFGITSSSEGGGANQTTTNQTTTNQTTTNQTSGVNQTTNQTGITNQTIANQTIANQTSVANQTVNQTTNQTT